MSLLQSNSGKTAEGVRLIQHLRGKAATTGIVAYAGTPIAVQADNNFVLGCGAETAVAATKSVIEQALFYDCVFRALRRKPSVDLPVLADAVKEALSVLVPQDIVQQAAAASILYFSGRNNGVAEELTLKTNEITRKRSDYLEGTYAVHGIEEVMSKDNVVFIIEPFETDEEKIQTVLVDGVGMTVVAIASRDTRFPTIRIPQVDNAYAEYVQLAAGWSVLVEIGIAAGINLDKPERARKVGNEYGV